jgi:hypothetical protein
MAQLNGRSFSMTAGKGIAAAEVSRGFFEVQLHYAATLSARTRISLAEAITFHTNFHRLFAYGNLAKMSPAEEFLSLVRYVTAIQDHTRRLDLLVAAFAQRPVDPWPPDRFPFGPCFACEAPDQDGAVRIHFRNNDRSGDVGPLHASKIGERRVDLTQMFAFLARRWPETKDVNGASWLYNTEGYRRLFPTEFTDSRTPLIGPRPIHGLSTWGQFLDFRGYAKPAIAEAFRQNLKSLDPAQPWLAFPYQVLSTTAPFEVFRREYGV